MNAPTTTDADGTLLPEHRRFCARCGGAVGRGRGGRPGRLRGTCPWCRAPFDLRPHLEPGTVLDGRRARWRVEGPFVRGGRAWTHRLSSTGTGGPAVAHRVLGPDGPEAGALAVEHPEALREVTHPGLVRLRDVVDGPGPQRHLVLDLAPGLPAGPLLPGPAAAAVVLGVVPALAALHDGGLLHADLTPEHLVVAPDGRVTLVDLGSLRRRDDRTSAVWGTDPYVAPEIRPGGAGPSPASEVWALGRVLAVLTAGRPRPGRVPGPVPDPDLARLVAAATATDAAARPGLGAFADTLAEFAPLGDERVRNDHDVRASPTTVGRAVDGGVDHGPQETRAARRPSPPAGATNP